MILTLTANPTIDRVLFVRNFAMQDVVRAEREVVSPSGKGIDVSIILHELGAETLAIALNAGLSGEMLAALLAARGVPCRFIPAQGETRVAALITDVAQGRQSTILAPTLRADASHLEALAAAVAGHASHAWGLVCAGSLPPGLPEDAWGHLLATGRRYGLLTLLDSSGGGLRHALEAGADSLPDILKINGRELIDLARALDVSVPTWLAPDDLLPLARFLRQQLGVWARQALIITLGAQGALAVTVDPPVDRPLHALENNHRNNHSNNHRVSALHGAAPAVPLVSPAGAGDAVAAGVMLARERGDDWPVALQLGVAAAAAVVMNEGTAVCTAAQVTDVLPQVPEPHRLDL